MVRQLADQETIKAAVVDTIRAFAVDTTTEDALVVGVKANPTTTVNIMAVDLVGSIRASMTAATQVVAVTRVAGTVATVVITAPVLVLTTIASMFMIHTRTTDFKVFLKGVTGEGVMNRADFRMMVNRWRQPVTVQGRRSWFCGVAWSIAHNTLFLYTKNTPWYAPCPG